MKLLKSLEKYQDRIIVLSTLSPVYISRLKWLEYGVAVYGTGQESFTAGFSAIAGDIIPEGILPFKEEE